MTQGPSATVVARMRALRQRTGLSAARLAEEMTKAGIPWRRETVANLETGRRDKLDVDELVALAVVFGVPPTALLVDPTSPMTPVAPEEQVPTAHALLWMLAEVPLQAMTGVWMDEQVPARLVRRLHEAVLRCRGALTELDMTDHFEADGVLEHDAAEDRRRVHERQLVGGLRELSRVVEEMRGKGMAVPLLDGQDQLDAAAQARGMTLGLQLAADGR